MAARSATAATCLSAPGSAPADPSPAPSTALGTGEGPLRYRICVPCSKRPPPVRDAFSEARRTKNPLLRYGRDIRCQKQASVVRDESSKARRTADSTDCGQPTARPDAFQRRAVPKAAPTHRTHFQRRAVPKAAHCHTGRIFSARNGPHSLCSLRPLPPFPSSR